MERPPVQRRLDPGRELSEDAEYKVQVELRPGGQTNVLGKVTHSFVSEIFPIQFHSRDNIENIGVNRKS